MLILTKCWLVLVLTLPRDCVTGRSTAAVSDAYHLTYDSRQLSTADTSTSLLNVECAIFDQICQTTGDIRHPCIITRVLMMGTRAPRHLSRVTRHVSRYKQLNTGEGRKLHSASVLTRVPSYCWVSPVELRTNLSQRLCEVFTIRAFSWLKAPTSVFTFKTLC